MIEHFFLIIKKNDPAEFRINIIAIEQVIQSFQLTGRVIKYV